MMTSRNEREIIQRVSTIFGIRSTQNASAWTSASPAANATSRGTVFLEELLTLDAQGVCDLEALETPTLTA